MFKWPDTPSARARARARGLCRVGLLEAYGSSQTAICAALNILEENDYTEGVPEEDEIPQLVENAYEEIERRRAACRGGYPFAIDENGHTLTPDVDEVNHRKTIYRYLLLATRLNMASNRKHAGIDGTLLLEEIASEVARDYLGARAESLVFGTGAGLTSFKARGRQALLLPARGRWLHQSQRSSAEGEGRQAGCRCMEAVLRLPAGKAHRLWPVQDRNPLQRRDCPTPA